MLKYTLSFVRNFTKGTILNSLGTKIQKNEYKCVYKYMK